MNINIEPKDLSIYAQLIIDNLMYLYEGMKLANDNIGTHSPNSYLEQAKGIRRIAMDFKLSNIIKLSELDLIQQLFDDLQEKCGKKN